jgi:sec-independent protein translocase protein TatA
MIGSFGTAQILILAFVVLMLFGHRLPDTMRSVGSSLREFRRGLHSDEGPEGNESV